MNKTALFCTVFAASLCAQTQERRQTLAELTEFLKIPNTANDPASLRRNAEWIRDAFQKRGVPATLLEAPGATPLVFGQLNVAGARQTVVFYAHYDGQPVDPRQWQGSAPFEPSLRGASPDHRDARIYARGASDDKGPIMAMLAALDTLRAAGRAPSVNIKFVFEGEEEAGSKNLGALLTRYRAQLQSDFWLICDGPVHQTRRMQVYFGARGITGFQLTVYGPKRELHSGHYGNWAPNPAMTLARLLASMKDDEGRVQIQGFYDGVAPLSEVEIAAMKAEPPVDGDLQNELLIGRTENSPRRLIEVLNQPSFNIRGLASGAVGEASRNVVPTFATASIDIRLVKGNDPAKMLELVRTHIRNLGYLLVENREPTDSERLQSPKVARLDVSEPGYRAVRTPMDLPVSRQVIMTLEAVHGPIVKMPTLGGSVPLATIEDVFGVPMIGIPIVNHDNNQHSHNENLRLENLWQGIATFVGLFTMPAL
ncbi:MAG TPA: M20/M25/M40 family metallo-hydrolase [Paludibaculum sp.]